MTAQEIDRAIEALARRQHGVFHHQQAIDLGATRRIIERRRANGGWLRLDRQVSALPGNPATWLRQAKAAQLSVPGSAVSGRSAAVVHGLGEVRAGAIEVTVGRGGTRTSALARVRLRDGLETTTVQGVRVLTVAQRLCDLAGCSSLSTLERAVDDALVRGLVDGDELAEHHAHMVSRRAKGAAVFGGVVQERTSGYVPPTSLLESALYAVLGDAGLPPFVRQHGFAWQGIHRQIVDAYIPSWGRIVEADGRLYHARLADFERDRARDHAAQMHGIEITRFTYRQLMDRSYALDVLLAIQDQSARAA